MLNQRQSLSEDTSNLEISSDIWQSNVVIKVFLDIVTCNFNVFCPFMKDKVGCNLDCAGIVLQFELCWYGQRREELQFCENPGSACSSHSQTLSEYAEDMEQYSTSLEDLEALYYLFL